MKRAAVFSALLVVTSCGRSSQLPAALRNCSGSSSGINATLRNDADRPIEAVEVSADFYANFRFVRTAGSATIPAGLNPGDSKDLTFAYDSGPAVASGSASRCIVTRILYLDGTSVSLPIGAR